MKTRWLVLDTVVGALLKLAALVAIAVWGLPQIGIVIPLWAVGLIGAALMGQSYYSHLIAVRLRKKKPVAGPETMTGRRCVVVRSLAPHGYVRVDGELWQATSSDGVLEEGAEAIVEALDGLRLVVKPVVKTDRPAP